MTKETMIRNYRKYSAADAYILGFIYSGRVYMAEVKEIAPRYIKIERECSKKGGHKKLQLRLSKKYQEELIKHNAACLGSYEILNGKYNKGVEFERVVAAYFQVEWKGKDNIPFYTAGDLTIKDKNIQIKFNGAQIVVETTLERLKKQLTKDYKNIKIKKNNGEKND